MSVVTVPPVTFDIVAAAKTVENSPQSILFVGQKTSGTATPGALTKNVGVSGEENTLFGKTSFLSAGIRAFRDINTDTRVDAIALDDELGTASTGTIVVSGTADETGTIKVSVQSVFSSTFTISIAVGNTNIQVAALIDAAVSARDDLILTSGVSTDTVTFTCAHDGTIGNNIIIKTEGSVSGISLVTTAMAGGGDDPDLTNLFDVVGEIRYQSICYPSHYSLTELKTFLDSRFNFQNKVLDGISILSITDASISSLKSQSVTLDSESICILPNKDFDTNEFRGGGLGELDYVLQAKILAIRALRLTENAVVSQFVSGSTLNARSTGGVQFATIPYQNTPIPGVSIVDTATWWNSAEQKDFNDNAVSVIGNNPNETSIILGQMKTTYQDADKVFSFLNAVDGSSAAREYFVNNNRQRYAQTQLTQGDIIGGAPMANEKSIKLFQVDLYDDLARLTIVPAGVNSDKFFRQNLTVDIDFNTGDVTIDAKLPLIVGLRQIIGTLRVTFNTNG